MFFINVYLFAKFLRRTTVSNLASIVAVMLFCSADYAAKQIAFERKAVRVFVCC